FPGESLAKNIALAEGVALAQQAVLMSTGLEKKFDWKTQVGAAFNATVGAVTDNELENELARIGIKTFAASGADAALNHHFDAGMMSANVLGSMIGSYAGSHITNDILKQQNVTFQNEQQNDDHTVANMGQTDIDVKDPRWSEELSEMASRRRNGAQNVALLSKKQTHNSYQLNQHNTKHTNSNNAINNILQKVKQSEQREQYSFMGDQSFLEKGIIYGAAGAAAVAVLPEVVVSTVGTVAGGILTASTLGLVSEGTMLGPLAEAAFMQGAGRLSTFVGTEGFLYKSGLFGKNSSGLAPESIGNIASQNHISGLRLQKRLNLEQASSIFNKEGFLTQEAINNAAQLPIGPLKNPKLIDELLARPGNISDWRKYATESKSSPSGDFQMHFYRNHITGDVYYGRDYKAVFNHQGMWNVSPQPNFKYETPQFY
ncbi:MAG: hypothetical protein P4M12_07710, partial [Gammaproteobacteria bacterium]|nr:hypothetical protein [Gammaproteobacteria bacterium]